MKEAHEGAWCGAQVCGILVGGNLSAVEYGADTLLDTDHPLHRALREGRVKTLLDKGDSAAASAALIGEADVHAAIALFLRATGHEAAQVNFSRRRSCTVRHLEI